MLTEVPLDCEATPEAFLPAATDFIHEQLWGSLSMTLIVDTPTLKKKKPLVREYVSDLLLVSIS